jgi:hypothetical protein
VILSTCLANSARTWAVLEFKMPRISFIRVSTSIRMLRSVAGRASGRASSSFAQSASGSSSEEVTLNWNKWVRQTHRWLSMAFTVAVIVNTVAVVQGKYSTRVGLLAVFPLALLLVTGLYLFVLPYATKWSGGRRTA